MHPGHHVGYVTDLLTPEYLSEQGFEISNLEVYICGSPAMVKDAREKLERIGVEKGMVFFEQY